MSGRRMAEIAQAQGHEIDRTQINHILKGTYPHRPKRPLLDALIYLSGEPREVVYNIAGEPLPLGDFRDELPEEADIMTVTQRQAVLAVVREFIATEKARAQDAQREIEAQGSKEALLNELMRRATVRDKDTREGT